MALDGLPFGAWLLPVGELLARGGTVMWAIFAATALLWALILERYLFHWLAWPRLVQALYQQWQARAERASWYARQVRGELVAHAAGALRRRLGLVRALTALLPLLGLLGTVSGMSHTFQVMAQFGTGNARGMAEGISQALLTTLAGLVGTLSGLYFSYHLDHLAERRTAALAGELALEEGR